MSVRDWKRPPAVRLALPAREVSFDDAFQGARAENPAREVGDFVLRRGDGVYAYQLAVVVDDRDMEVSEVVRGVDLLSSAARQIALAELLGARAPAFAHVPLVLGHGGERLQKRRPQDTLRGQRAQGVRPEAIIARLARALGLLDTGTAAITPSELLAHIAGDFSPLRQRTEIRL